MMESGAANRIARAIVDGVGEQMKAVPFLSSWWA